MQEAHLEVERREAEDEDSGEDEMWMLFIEAIGERSVDIDVVDEMHEASLAVMQSSMSDIVLS